jgi:hypothetical protein
VILKASSRAPRRFSPPTPINRTRRYQIKKLEGVPAGEGQYRLSLGRWRFRYDIAELHYCGLRREDTYRNTRIIKNETLFPSGLDSTM